MRLTVPELTVTTDRAVVTCIATLGGEDRPWWISVPAEAAGWLDVSLAPFLPTALMVAAALGEDVDVDGALTATQLDGARQAVGTLAPRGRLRVPRPRGIVTVPAAVSAIAAVGAG